MERYSHSILNEDILKLPGFESFCYQNCQRILLQAMGVKYPELYINATLSLNFNTKSGVVGMGSRIRSLLPSVDKYVFRTEYETESAEEIFSENKAFIIKNKIPVIVGADTFYLPYASNYMKNHARHTLLLCGFDESADNVSIVDWYPDWYFKGTVPTKLFLKSRGSDNPYDGTIFSGCAIKNNCAYIERFEEKNPSVLIRELLSVMRSEYYSAPTDSIVYGIDAVVAIQSRIMDENDAVFFKSLHKKINITSKRYKFFRQYILSASKVMNLADFESSVICLDNVINDWDIILMLLLKASMAPGERIKARLKSKTDMLINDEEILKSKLLKLRVN